MHGRIEGAASGGGPAGASPAPASRLPIALRLALRELRAGLSGFGIFIACIALGVASIAGVTSVAHSLVAGIASQGRTILGGDLAASVIGREASSSELRYLQGRGALSRIAGLRAMADAGEPGVALVEIKAVDAGYPTAGTVETDPARPLAELLAVRDGIVGAVADPVLFERLAIAPGARIKVGAATIELRAKLTGEPDKIAAGIGFGPRLLMSLEGMEATGLVQPGSLVRWTYRVVLPPGRDGDEALAVEEQEARDALAQAGFDIRTRGNADRRFSRNIERFTQFLTLVGMTALLVGGVGVANAVAAFVDRKRRSIGILKALGATGNRVVGIYLVQVMLITGIGVAIGLAVGAALPFAVAAAARTALPVPIEPILSPADLGVAALYGLLTALAFSLVPLGRARDVPVSGLFRDRLGEGGGGLRGLALAGTVLSGLALVALAIGTAEDRRVAAMFVLAAGGAFVLLRLVAAGVMAVARRLPHAPGPLLRLAIANLHRPGALTPSLVLSLGLGITLLVTLAGIEGSLRREIGGTLAERAPNFFFVDVPSRQAEDFRAFLGREAPGGTIEQVPMMRGRITALGERSAAEVKSDPDAAWVLEGDRGITYSSVLPEGSTLVEGEWWPADYRGKPLVSFDAELARGIGLKRGDTVTVNVLGRPITATIANLRRIEWRRLGISFVMVFSPNTFAGAPHSDLMTLTLPGRADPALEGRILREAARAFPAVTSVRVREALEVAGELVGQLLFAIRVASGVALLSSLLVLAGALAAGHRARLYDAVVLKTMGATRPRLLAAYVMEYGVLGIVTAIFGLLAGSLAGWAVVTRLMKIDYAPSLGPAVLVSAAAVVVAVFLGLAGTWRVLGQKPAPYLRTL